MRIAKLSGRPAPAMRPVARLFQRWLATKSTSRADSAARPTKEAIRIAVPFSRPRLSNRAMIRDYFASSPLVHIKAISHTKAEGLFLENLNDTIYTNIDDPELDVEKLARKMMMSRITLYRKIKAISNLTPIEFINIVRLKKAAELLAEGDYKIYEVADMVGFSSQSNFARNFHKQFDLTPTDYMQTKLIERKKNQASL